MASAPLQDSERRLIIIGKTGTGKSATGNSILDNKAFVSKMNASGVTQSCIRGIGQRFGRQWHVIDTPGLCDSGTEKGVLEKEIRRCIGMSIPGPHAFVIVLSIGRFTEEDRITIEYYAKIFGKEMFRFAIVLFTGEDDLEAEDKTFDNFLENAPKPLSSLLKECSNRVLCLNNRADKAKMEEKVKELLTLIDSLPRENKKSYYTNEIYDLAMKKVEEDKEKERTKLEKENMDKELIKEKLASLEKEILQRNRDLADKSEWLPGVITVLSGIVTLCIAVTKVGVLVLKDK